MKRILFILVFASAIGVDAQPFITGELDTTFNHTGIATTYFENPADLIDIRLLPTEKIITVSYYTGTSSYLVAQYLPDGQLDPSFSDDGVYFGDEIMHVTCFEVSASGAITIAGYRTELINTDIILCRLLPEGIPDPAFGTEGVVKIETEPVDEWPNDIVINEEGKILIALNYADTSAIYQLMPNGELDTTFNNDGIITIPDLPFPSATQYLTIQPDMKILAGITYDDEGLWYDVALVRLNPDGSIDTDFANNGFYLLEIDTATEWPVEVNVDVGGNITLINSSVNFEFSGFNVTRLYADGSPDLSFSDDGFAYGYYGEQGPYALSWLRSIQRVDADRMMIIGHSSPDGVFDTDTVLISMFYLNGEPDMGFGTDGYIEIPLDDYLSVSSLIQSDGKLVIGGVWSTGHKLVRLMTDPIVNTIDLDPAVSALYIFPNPVADETTLRYTLHEQTSVTISLYNMNGNKIREFFSDVQNAGDHEEVLIFPSTIARGNYIVSITSPVAEASIQVTVQ